MKLSLKKRFGWVHVRGGRLLRVVKEHAVTTHTKSQLDPHIRPDTDDKWVYCKVGDLALEIVAVKTGKLLGHAYIAGPAVQLHRYGSTDPAWFEPAMLGLVHLAPPNDKRAMEAWMERAMYTLLEFKYGELDVAAWRVPVIDQEDFKRFGEFVTHTWQMAPFDKNDKPVKIDPPPKTHLVALAQAKKPIGTLHFQPPQHASDHCATGFQIEMLVAAAEQQEDSNGQ